MLNRWRMMQRFITLTLLLLFIAACGAAPDQASTPAASPPAASPASPTDEPSTPLPPTVTASPAAPSNTPTSAALLDNRALTSQIYRQVQEGTPVAEIADPQIPLPDDVYPGQIKKYFQIGTLAIGLVLQPSMNVVLNLPATDVPSFTGVVVSEGGAPWRKYLEIQDTEPTDKNNPYYLWAQDGNLYLSIVDQRGAGSGEGIMKLVTLAATGDWVVEGCYYFGGNYGGVESDGDYFAFSQYLDKHQEESASRCQTGNIVLLP